MTKTSLESPFQVKELNSQIEKWINRLGAVHVEGQVTQINKRPGNRTAFVTLRDPNAAASISVTCEPKLLGDLKDGAHVVIFGRPQFWSGRGTLQVRASEIHQLGEGDLLARQEKLRKDLREEGLFRPELKKPLPFLPRKIGLITAKDSAAERDVIRMAHDRWPIEFNVKHIRVQGRYTVGEALTSLNMLDAEPDVDVIIIARGGGSVEDLLPFSDERLVRAAFAATTPIISAIGHEPDNPILDDVADLRAATPTDAAKRVVPSLDDELRNADRFGRRLNSQVINVIEKERNAIDQDVARCRQHPVNLVKRDQHNLELQRLRIDRRIEQLISTDKHQLDRWSTQLDAFNPNSVLDRGFAVLETVDGQVISSVYEAEAQEQFIVRFIDGAFLAGPIRKGN